MNTSISAKRRILVVLLGLGPMYVFVIASHLITGGSYTLKEMMLYPLIVGTGMIGWISLLYKKLAGKSLPRLNRKPGSWPTDALVGIVLGAGLLGLFCVQQSTIQRWLPGPPPNPAVFTLIQGLVRNPWLLALWLGPVVWIGVAAFEEVQRAFMLDLLADISPKARYKVLFLFLSAILFGFAHLYQGPAGIAGTFLFAIVMGLYYLKGGRLGPMIISHALYDSFQIVLAVIQIRRMGG